MNKESNPKKLIITLGIIVALFLIVYFALPGIMNKKSETNKENPTIVNTTTDEENTGVTGTDENKPHTEDTVPVPDENLSSPIESEKEAPQDVSIENDSHSHAFADMDSLKRDYSIQNDYTYSASMLEKYKKHGLYSIGKKDPFTSVVVDNGEYVEALFYPNDKQSEFKANPLSSSEEEPVEDNIEEATENIETEAAEETKEDVSETEAEETNNSETP